MEFRSPAGPLNSVDEIATQPRTDPATNTQSAIGNLDGQPISPASSQPSSLLANIGNTITRWWSGNQNPTENQLASVRKARLQYFVKNIRPTASPKSSSPDYRSTITGSTFAERYIARDAARQAQQKPATVLPLPPTVRKESTVSQQRAEAAERRQAAEAASSQTSPSSDIKKSDDEEIKLTNNTNDLSQSLLTRCDEIAESMSSLDQQIKTQTKIIKRAQKDLEEADATFAHLTMEQFEQLERPSLNTQNSSAAIRSAQDYEYQGSTSEDLGATLKKETDKLTSFQEQAPLLQQQLNLMRRVHAEIDAVQSRLTTLEEEYKKLGVSTDKRLIRGNKLLLEARTLLSNIATTTLAIANERNPNIASAQIEAEDSSTQLQKATRSLDQAENALNAVNPNACKEKKKN